MRSAKRSRSEENKTILSRCAESFVGSASAAPTTARPQSLCHSSLSSIRTICMSPSAVVHKNLVTCKRHLLLTLSLSLPPCLSLSLSEKNTQRTQNTHTHTHTHSTSTCAWCLAPGARSRRRAKVERPGGLIQRRIGRAAGNGNATHEHGPCYMRHCGLRHKHVLSQDTLAQHPHSHVVSS
jgi:hypothetical protein